MPAANAKVQTQRFRLIEGNHVQNEIINGVRTMIPDPRQERDDEGKVIPTPQNPQGKVRMVGKSVQYSPGDVFEAATDLAARMGPEKFELVEGSRLGTFQWDPKAETLEAFNARVKASFKDQEDTTGGTDRIDHSADKVLESMSEQELKAHAEENEIDLKGAKGKNDMLRAIKAAMAPARR